MSNLISATLSSKALYSSWCHLPFQDLLFDAGEGAATSIGNDLSNVTKIFLSHAHGDHTLGLPSIIGCRNNGRSISRNEETFSHNKRLDIYYPEDNTQLHTLLEFIEAQYGKWLRYEIAFHPIGAGAEVEINKDTFVRAISMQHQKNKLTLGYVIYERRKRLRTEYRGLDIPLLKKEKNLKDADLMEYYRSNLFAYCLDSFKIDDPTELKDCPKVVMDCTFLDAKDRDDMTHFTIDEAVDVCDSQNVKHMYAAHISPRYHNLPVDGKSDSGMDVTIIKHNSPTIIK